MKVLVTGASGMVGAELTKRLQIEGHDVSPLRRGKLTQCVEPTWDPEAGSMDLSKNGPWDAVVHLAGENIAAGRWTDKLKRSIRDSRVNGTRLLCKELADSDHKPTVIVCASAVGYYGDSGDVELNEESPNGEGFLPTVCHEWEQAAQPARDAGIRVVHLRIGVVLGREGGALAKMLTPFKMGAGGVIGNGKQYMSWITLNDVVRSIIHSIKTESLAGPVNAVAPEAVTNRAFTKTLGRVLSRPTIFPMPAFAARIAFGEMADALLLSSIRVVPNQLASSGFVFDHPKLEGALSSILK
ncbi:MAG: hypothetical protein DHS20C16_05660 [Phycisphaerae bacterium]|nr:MAG: hypothetical protein DHS20C16_05660 [Phycisphaerae bacterium]